MRRLGISLLVVVIISVVGAGWAIDRLFMQLDKPDQLLQSTEALGYRLAELVDRSGQPLNELNPLITSSAVSMELLDEQSIALPETLQTILESGEVLTLESEQGVSLYFYLPQTRRVMRIGLPEPSHSDTQLRLLLTLMFYAAIVTLILLWLFPLVRRLQRMSLAAKLFGKGNLSQRIETNAGSQLHDIESEFNHMAQRIESLIVDNKLLSSAVSHDLKTPLARLRFGVDALSEQPANAVQKKYLERISNDLTAMEQLVEVLLEFARLDQGLSELPLQPVALNVLLHQCVQKQIRSTDKFIECDTTSNSVYIMAEPRYTVMLMNNLIQNAIKFSQYRIQITLRQTSTKVLFVIEDDGSGFQADNPELLLQPFVKGQCDAVDQNLRGHGMGLAIVQRVADWHKAVVELGVSARLGGAQVVVQFDILTGFGGKV